MNLAAQHLPQYTSTTQPRERKENLQLELVDLWMASFDRK